MRTRAVLIGLVAALAGCAAPAPSRPRPVSLSRPTRAAVMPFAVDVDGSGPSAVPADLGTTVARDLAGRLGDAGVPVVDPDRVLAAAPAVGSGDPAAMRLARKLGASVVVTGVVTRYQEREGTAWSVRAPASVAYQATLLRADDGAVLSVDKLDYTQHSLSENLLELPRFVRGGARWLTRTEILDGALTATAERFARALAGGTAGAAAR